MPRSINFCYKEVRSNLEDLSNLYGHDYKSLDMAREICLGLTNEQSKNIHAINLRQFITDHLVKNNQLSLLIASDFNLN